MGNLGEVRFRHLGIPSTGRITPQHFTCNNLKEFLGDNFFDYKFTIVRDPYNRIESEYRQHWIISRGGFWQEAPTFSHFLESNILETRNNAFHRDNHMRPQVDFLGSNVKVFRYELGLNAILQTVCDDLGLPFSPAAERVFSSDAFTGEIKWDLQDRLSVNAFYEKDFSVLGYPLIES